MIRIVTVSRLSYPQLPFPSSNPVESVAVVLGDYTEEELGTDAVRRCCYSIGSKARDVRLESEMTEVDGNCMESFNRGESKYICRQDFVLPDECLRL